MLKLNVQRSDVLPARNLSFDRVGDVVAPENAQYRRNLHKRLEIDIRGYANDGMKMVETMAFVATKDSSVANIKTARWHRDYNNFVGYRINAFTSRWKHLRIETKYILALP